MTNPIQIDSRTGSKEFKKYFPNGLAELTRLQYGDFAFWGNGPEGPVHVGIERKTVHEILNDKARFASNQLPGMLNTYNICYLVVEGVYKEGKDGALQTYARGGWKDCYGRRLYREFINTLNTYMLKAGMHVWGTRNKEDTAAWITSTYHWWSDKAYDAHRSHIGLGDNRVTFERVGPVRRHANLVDGIGWQKSLAAARHYKSVRQFANAEEEELAELTYKSSAGKQVRVGPAAAKKAVEYLRRGE